VKALRRLPLADRYRLFGTQYSELLERINDASKVAATAADRLSVKHSGGRRTRQTIIKELAAYFAFVLILDAMREPTTSANSGYFHLAELLVEAATGREVTVTYQCKEYVRIFRPHAPK
jgi:hypothetical protein